MRRAIRIEGTDTELVISSAVALHQLRSKLYLEELPNGTWRLSYSAELFPDFKTVQKFIFADMNAGDKSKDAVKFRIQVVECDPESKEEKVDQSWTIRKLIGINPSPKQGPNPRFIYFDKLTAGDGWSMIYRSDLIPVLTDVKGLTIIRED